VANVLKEELADHEKLASLLSVFYDAHSIDVGQSSGRRASEKRADEEPVRAGVAVRRSALLGCLDPERRNLLSNLATAALRAFDALVVVVCDGHLQREGLPAGFAPV
jgi:hypothetical protein